MADYILRVYTDVLTEKATLSSALPGGNRGLYLADGMATVRDERGGATLSANSAWFSTGDTTITAGANGARVLRYELVKGGTPDADGLAQGDGVTSIHKLSAAVDLEPGDGYLWRCDRVDIPPSGIAYTHVHQGPGIRCLLEGGFKVETGLKPAARPTLSRPVSYGSRPDRFRSLPTRPTTNPAIFRAQ